MFFCKQVVDFLYLHMKSAEAVKKGQIVKEPDIFTNLKKTCQDKLLGQKRRHVWKIEFIW